MQNKYKELDISLIDLENSFFHYTNKNNLDNIFKNGLKPKIGKNSFGLEENKKVFFVKGQKGILKIMDIWIKWLILRPRNDFIYYCGTITMGFPLFPKIFHEICFNKWTKSKNKKERAFKDFNNILKNSVILKLNLIENEDLDYNVLDEVKSKKRYRKKYLSMIYSEEELKTTYVDFWNIHTYKEVVISKEKISLVKDRDEYCLNELLRTISKNNIEYTNQLVYLKEYLEYFLQNDSL